MERHAKSHRQTAIAQNYRLWLSTASRSGGEIYTGSKHGYLTNVAGNKGMEEDVISTAIEDMKTAVQKRSALSEKTYPS